MHYDNFTLTMTSAQRLIDEIRKAESEAIEKFTTQGDESSAFIGSLRVFNMQRELVCIGVFSRFEAIIQGRFPESSNPVAALEKQLAENGYPVMANSIKIQRMANNVLKHGKGRSYDWLTEQPMLGFGIKKEGKEFFFEGDVREIETLIDTADPFFEMMSSYLIAGQAFKPNDIENWPWRNLF